MHFCVIVDDDVLSRKLTCQIVEEFQAEIAEADSLVDALTICEKRIPDLIILDCAHFSIDGIEFMYDLREMDPEQKAHILGCVENGVNSPESAVKAGITNFVAKPFVDDELANKLLSMGLKKNTKDYMTKW